ncbi:MAG: dehydrogenase [Spirochaetaceae bacterium]|jgi:D-glycero-alpha-D-manno-heptose-7-phosphate kinase|nr:dehydrogenase [Spirochaetaceae bacterium]
MTIRSKAPLRLGLAGGGTDIASYYREYGGSVLNASIDMYAYCTIEPGTADGYVEFYAADMDTRERYAAGTPLPVDTKLKLHCGVYNRILRDFPAYAPRPPASQNGAFAFTMTTYSDAPPGSGLGSSSTLVVAIIKAYVEYLNLPLGEYEIAALAYSIEREDLGLAGGKQDQYAATFGGFNFMEFYADEKVIVNPLRLKRWIRNELESSLVLYYTGVSRESANIIKAQIKSTQSHDVKRLDSMHKIKASSLLMKETLLKGDFAGFSACLNEAWQAKKSAADAISSPFIDLLYDFAIANGAESAKISGAGGGGFMMIYCNPVNRVRLVNALKEKGGVIFNTSFTEIGTQAWTIY